MANSKTSGGIGLPAILFIVFLILKLTDNIDWSWWWVTSPLWIPFAVVFGIIAIFLFIFLIAIIFGADIKIEDVKSKLNKIKK